MKSCLLKIGGLTSIAFVSSLYLESCFDGLYGEVAFPLRTTYTREHTVSYAVCHLCTFQLTPSLRYTTAMEILPIKAKWHICRSVKANPFVKFGDSVTLQKAVFELKEGRRGRLFLKHARRLDIVCLWNYSEKPWHQSNMIYRSMELVHYGLPASENTFLKYCLKECLDPELWPYIPDFRHYQEENWQPLVSLIAYLEHLSELNFVVKNMYPPSLHQVLRPYHPECPGRPWINSNGILPIICVTPCLKYLNIRGRSSHSVTLLKSLGKEYTA
ncbi:hypothetical protein BDV41DRAFT_584101 [Aspergillus transmontanensis]|uniref:Uncharacterized protein n=1 Tax=Aspergillus transmontanensis TaxID=1034304 RepID=A0A5N6VHV0_9EURO|nr:hypothetical protein BDV41DRAFT_584101 [Aspergillus transmontanensis]